VIAGEVLDARHRGARRRTVVGSAVLSATGVVAGLSLLLSNGSAKTSADRRAPVAAAPEHAPEPSPTHATATARPAAATHPARPAVTPRTAAPMATPAPPPAPAPPALTGDPGDPGRAALAEAQAWITALAQAAAAHGEDGHRAPWHHIAEDRGVDGWWPGRPH
jgi:hypothetical protein